MNFYEKIDKEVSIHGLDIGNSTLVNNQDLILDAKITTSKPFKDADMIEIEGKIYYLGYGTYDTTFKKIDKENYINMLYGLLALSTNTVNNKIGLGLPLSQYNSDKEKLIDKILLNNKKTVKVNDEFEKSIVIQDVEVFPEGVSTLKDDEECIIIDLGGGTTDCGLVVNERSKRRVINPITIPKGTIKLYDAFANKLIFSGLDVSLEDAERILNRGYLYKQGDKEKNIAFDEYNNFVEDIVSKLQLNYNLKIYPISITGGGGGLLYNALKERLKGSNITLQHEPIKANARNFYELACSVFAED